jgi:NAD(P) transhydrogenase subunit beta
MTELAYLGAGVLFILGLKGLTSPRTARRGNQLAAIGMLVATVVVVVDLIAEDAKMAWGIVVAGMVAGAVIGAILAIRVKMTSMPELVAAFNGFGGGASALVAAAAIVATGGDIPTETAVTTFLSLVIGAVTLTGSFVAFGKLQGIFSGRPIRAGGVVTNAILAIAAVASGVVGVSTGEPIAYWAAAGLAGALGIVTVIGIGGADMPVVISLLNSLSGVAAAMAGFVIRRQLRAAGRRGVASVAAALLRPRPARCRCRAAAP